MRVVCLFLSVIFFATCSQKSENRNEANSTPVKCTYARNEKSSAGKLIRVVEDEKFIALSFQDSAMIKEFNGDDYLKGYLSCVSVDSTLGIYFNFRINSADAFQYYGMIKKNNKINFILQSGKGVEVPFQTTFSGNTNLSRDFSEYSTFSVLTRAQAQQLLSEDLGRVIISWTKKDEEYKVVNPKIFHRQLPCVQ